MSNFELDNRISKIVSEKLNFLQEKIIVMEKDTRANQVSFSRVTEKQNEIHGKLERDAKARDLIKELKQQMLLQEKNVLKDIKDCQEVVDQSKMRCDEMMTRINRLDEERKIFIKVKDGFKSELKDFEALMEEFKAIHEKDFLSQTKKFKHLEMDVANKLQDMLIDRNQMRAMIRNQNYHFTEMQKSIASATQRVEELDERTEPLGECLKSQANTDKYLQFFLPVWTSKAIHESIEAATVSLGNTVKRDLYKYSSKQVYKHEKEIALIGDEQQPVFKKATLGNTNWMKMDSKVAELVWEVEEEEREKKEALQEEEQAKLTRKPSELIFRERLFTTQNVDKMATMLGPALEPVIDKISGECVKNSPEVKELLEFYKLGADDENDEYGEEGEENENEMSEEDDNSERDSSDGEAGSDSSEDSDSSGDDSDSPKKGKVRGSVAKKQQKAKAKKEKAKKAKKKKNSDSDDSDSDNSDSDSDSKSISGSKSSKPSQSNSTGSANSALATSPRTSIESSVIKPKTRMTKTQVIKAKVAEKAKAKRQKEVKQQEEEQERAREKSRRPAAKQVGKKAARKERREPTPSAASGSDANSQTRRRRRSGEIDKLGRLRDLSQNTDRDSDRGDSSDQNHSRMLGDDFKIKKIGGKDKQTPMDSEEEEQEGRGGRNRNTQHDKNRSEDSSSEDDSNSDRREQYSEESDAEDKRRKARKGKQVQQKEKITKSLVKKDVVKKIEFEADRERRGPEEEPKKREKSKEPKKEKKEKKVKKGDDELKMKKKPTAGKDAKKQKSGRKMDDETKQAIQKMQKRVMGVVRSQSNVKQEIEMLKEQSLQRTSLDQTQNESILEALEDEDDEVDLDVSHISMQEEGDSILESGSHESQYAQDVSEKRVMANSEATKRSNQYEGGDEEQPKKKKKNDKQESPAKEKKKSGKSKSPKKEKQEKPPKAGKAEAPKSPKGKQKAEAKPVRKSEAGGKRPIVKEGIKTPAQMTSGPFQKKQPAKPDMQQQSGPNSKNQSKLDDKPGDQRRVVQQNIAGGGKADTQAREKPQGAIGRQMASKRPPLGGANGGGSAITRNIFSEVQKEFTYYTQLDEYLDTKADVARCLANVAIFARQMEVYKTSFLNQPSVNISILNSTNQSEPNLSPDLNQSSVNESPQQKQMDTNTTLPSKQHFGSDLSKKNKSIITVSNASINRTKPSVQQADNKSLTQNPILLALQATINTLYKKVHQLEKTIGREILGKMPDDIDVLSTDEVLKRQNIASIVQQADVCREKIDAELKRLRREHYTNIRSIENVETMFKQNQDRVVKVLDRQQMNDLALATVFKVMKIDYSLEDQDESDRKDTFLMGMSGDGAGASLNIATTAGSKFSVEGSIGIGLEESILSSGSKTARSPRRSQYGESVSKVRASTRIPLEAVQKNKDGRNPQIALDRNCLTCNQSAHNETVMKAFKMACLKYEPGVVQFEQSMYTRKQLIEAKYGLMQFCLSQLKHLDLGNIYQKKFAEQLEQSLKVSQQSKRTAPTTEHGGQQVDYSMIDPRDLPNFPPTSRTSKNTQNNNWMVLQSMDSYGRPRAMLNSALSPPTTSTSINDKSRYNQAKRASQGKVKPQLNIYGPGKRARHQTINPIAMSDGSHESMGMNDNHMVGGNRVGTAYQQSLDLGVDGGMANFFQQPMPMSQHKRHRGNQQPFIDMTSSQQVYQNNNQLMQGWHNMASPTQSNFANPQMMNFSSANQSGFSDQQMAAMLQQQHMRHNLRLPSLKEQGDTTGATSKITKNMNSQPSGSLLGANSKDQDISYLVEKDKQGDILGQKQPVQFDQNSIPLGDSVLDSQTSRQGVVDSPDQVASNPSERKQLLSKHSSTHGSRRQAFNMDLKATEGGDSEYGSSTIKKPAPMPHDAYEGEPSLTTPDVSNVPSSKTRQLGMEKE